MNARWDFYKLYRFLTGVHPLSRPPSKKCYPPFPAFPLQHW